jgi:hypothetical protein
MDEGAELAQHLHTPAGLAAEATVCAQLLQTVDRADNLVLKERLRDWSK